MKIQNVLLSVIACCSMTACHGESVSHPASPVPAAVNVAPVAVPVAPAQRGFGPAPLRPHFTERNSNRNVKQRTATPYPVGTTPAHQRDVVTFTDAALNGTAGAKSIVIQTAPVPAQPAPVQPVKVEPYIGW